MFKINNTAQFYKIMGLPKTRQAQYVKAWKCPGQNASSLNGAGFSASIS